MATWKLPPQVSIWINRLSQPLHGRLAWRLLPLLSGMLFAQGRRTVSSWLRAGDLGQDYKPFYYFLGSVGRCSESIASRLLRLLAGLLPLPEPRCLPSTIRRPSGPGRWSKERGFTTTPRPGRPTRNSSTGTSG